MQDIIAAPFRRGGSAPPVASQESYKEPSPEPEPLSQWSSPAVPDSGWCAQNFMLGAGMVVIQPSTHKIVVVYETKAKYWFFPRGRKDIGESLETTALRECYEESGYEATFLPLYTPTKAPPPPHDRDAAYRMNTEPIFVTLTSWGSRPRIGRRPPRVYGYEYLTSWYVGQIPEDAVHKTGTGMPDEQNYQSHLLTYDEAMERVFGSEKMVLEYAWAAYVHTLEVEREREVEAAKRAERRKSERGSFRGRRTDPSNPRWRQ